MGPGRIPFLLKDPDSYREFCDALAKHDAMGSALTMRVFQGRRPPLSAFEDGIKRIASPTLIIVGDEDDACIEASLYLKSTIQPSGLAMFQKTGHTLNLEEPVMFNATVERFLKAAEAGSWPPRDPRSRRD
jgi:proline iminopeptidase